MHTKAAQACVLLLSRHVGPSHRAWPKGSASYGVWLIGPGSASTSRVQAGNCLEAVQSLGAPFVQPVASAVRPVPVKLQRFHTGASQKVNARSLTGEQTDLCASLRHISQTILTFTLDPYAVRINLKVICGACMHVYDTIAAMPTGCPVCQHPLHARRIALPCLACATIQSHRHDRRG